MGRLTLKNVSEKAGLLYFRRKIRGKDTYIRLPAADSPDFLPEYQRLSSPDTERPRPAHGTIAALVSSYRDSATYRANGSATRSNQARYLDMIAAEHGHRTVAGVRPVHVLRMRDPMAATPGKANNWLSVFRNLMTHAIMLDLRTDNPADKVTILPIGEHEPWPADILRAALDVATPMTRLAIVTGLCSGQRVSDAIRMQWGWIENGIMQFAQQKTKKDVAIPMHPFWVEELAKMPRRSVTLLYERSGAPFKTTGAIQERLRALMAKPELQEVIADLVAREVIAEGVNFTFHGLRKNACCYQLELGLSDTEVGSILGMSPDMVRHYGKRARALMIARGAADRVNGGKIVPLAGGNSIRALPRNG